MNYDTFQQLRGAQILDVRLGEDYEESHLRDAINNCVFEVSFTDRLKETAPDKEAPTVICGASEISKEAQMAYEKLERLGYKDLHLLSGGLKDAPEELLELGIPVPPSPDVLNGRHDIDLEVSYVEWVAIRML